MCAVLALIGLLPMVVWTIQRTAEESLQDKLNEFDRLRAIAAYESKITELPATGVLDLFAGMTFKGSTAAEASSEILLSLSRHPAAADIQILRTVELPPKDLGEVQFVGQSIELTGSWTALLGFIAIGETHTPPLFIERLAIRGPVEGTNSPEVEPTYTAELQVFGATAIAPHAGSIVPP